MKDYEQDCMHEMRKKNEEYTVNLVCVYLAACGVLQWVGFILYESRKSILCYKVQTFWSNLKIFTGSIEQAIRHPPVKYLSIWMILKFSHKLIYNHRYT